MAQSQVNFPKMSYETFKTDIFTICRSFEKCTKQPFDLTKKCKKDKIFLLQCGKKYV